MRLLIVVLLSTSLNAAEVSKQEKINGQKWLVGTWKIKTDKSNVNLDDTGAGWLVFLEEGRLTMTNGNARVPIFEMLIISGDGKSAKRVDYYVNGGPSKAAPASSIYFLFENSPQSRDERFFGKGNNENEYVFILDNDKKTLKLGAKPIAEKVDEPQQVSAILKKLDSK